MLIRATKYNDTEEYQYMTLLGSDGVYSPNRIQAETLPEGFFRYELSAGKDKRFSYVRASARTNYAGDFLTKKPIELGPSGKVKLHESDWSLDSKRKFEFEAFWGHKLSIDKQISNAVYKRDLAMGKGPDGREAQQANSVDRANYVL